MRRHLAVLTLILSGLPALAAAQPYGYTGQVTTGSEYPYPEVPVGGEAWFDIGGFCKVVDVGSMADWAETGAKGKPVFIPGPDAQWENFRNKAPAGSHGQLALTTCCRPSSNVATLCAMGTNPSSIAMQYGEFGVDYPVSGTCYDQWGYTFEDTVVISCGGDNGPDGQGVWREASEAMVCAPNAYDSGCNAGCGGVGTDTIYDSCGNVQSVSTCYGGACPPPPPAPAPTPTPPDGGSSASCQAYPYTCGGQSPVSYYDCGGSCELAGFTPPLGGDASTWATSPTPQCPSGQTYTCGDWIVSKQNPNGPGLILVDAGPGNCSCQ